MTVRRPNPSSIQGWRCVLCGDSTVRWGRVRLRVGWFMRWVHVDCWERQAT